MARGKQAVLSARRRAESAHEVIDRLTSELAEAKLRARLVEEDAARVPRLVSEAADLRHQLEAATAPEIERLKSRHEAATADLRSKNDALVQLAVALWKRSGISIEEAAVLRDSSLDLTHIMEAVAATRTSRRNLEHIEHFADFMRKVGWAKRKGLA